MFLRFFLRFSVAIFLRFLRQNLRIWILHFAIWKRSDFSAIAIYWDTVMQSFLDTWQWDSKMLWFGVEIWNAWRIARTKILASTSGSRLGDAGASSFGDGTGLVDQFNLGYDEGRVAVCCFFFPLSLSRSISPSLFVLFSFSFFFFFLSLSLSCCPSISLSLLLFVFFSLCLSLSKISPFFFPLSLSFSIPPTLGGGSFSHLSCPKVGCAVGNGLLPMLRANPSLFGIGCDLSPVAIELLKQKARIQHAAPLKLSVPKTLRFWNTKMAALFLHPKELQRFFCYVFCNFLATLGDFCSETCDFAPCDLKMQRVFCDCEVSGR